MSQTASNELPIQEGAVAGAVAWVVGVFATFVLFQLGVYAAIYTSAVSQAPVAGSIWYYFIFHVWFIGSGELVGTHTVNMLVPIVMLLAAGFYVANRGQTESTQEGFLRGATVTLGYAALMAVSWLLLLVTFVGTPPGVGLHSEGLPVLLVMGVAYPVVFGGIGGMLGSGT